MVSALIFLPLVAEVAHSNPALPPPAVLVFMAVTMTTGSMAFPITSFPNVNSMMAEDSKHKTYLAGKNYLGAGAMTSVCVCTQLLTYMLPYVTSMLPGRIDGVTVAPK